MLTPKCRHTLNYTDVIFVLCPSIPTAFAHTWCISPSVTAFSSFIRRATSLLRGRRGRSRAVHRISLGENQKPRLTRRGRSCAMHRISLGEHKEPRLVRIFAPCGYFHENLYKKTARRIPKKHKKKAAGRSQLGIRRKRPARQCKGRRLFPDLRLTALAEGVFRKTPASEPSGKVSYPPLNYKPNCRRCKAYFEKLFTILIADIPINKVGFVINAQKFAFFAFFQRLRKLFVSKRN